jgi:predicted ATP-binding protein involved in virulence
MKNFKGFPERTLEFHPSFNLIVGDNGDGKTSVLDALSVAVGSWLLGISGHKSRVIQQGEAYIITRFINKKFEPSPQYPIVISAHGCVQGIEIDWTRTLENVDRITTYKGALNIKSIAESAAFAVMHGEPVTLPVISYYGAGRLWQEPRDMATPPLLLKLRRAPQDFAKDKEIDDSEYFGSRLAGYRFSVDPRCSPRDLIKWMRHERRIELDEDIKSTSFRLVLDAIRSCLPGNEKVRYSIRHHSLMVDVPKHGIVAFSNLSDGYRNMVAMVGDLAYKISQLNPHLGKKALDETPGVVLIDELDLHLHPKWQRIVIAALKRTFKKVQFICTTHSPQLVGQAKADEIILLDSLTEKHPGQSYGMDSNWILRHVMGGDDRDPMTATTLDKIFEDIEEGKFDEAKKAIVSLRTEIGDHPDLVEAEALISSYTRFSDKKAKK